MDNRNSDENGWVSSAQAWIDRMPETGDFAREFILDKPMLERALMATPSNFLDIGCGDGRYCRQLKAYGIERTGIDPVRQFVEIARQQDPDGRYKTGFAETLPFCDNEFDLVVFYLTLIDIDDVQQAIREAARVLRPRGTLLIANLNSFTPSNGNIGWIQGQDERWHYPLGEYHSQKKEWFEWDNMRVRNWHRPLNVYMKCLLECGMTLKYFDEPVPVGCSEAQIERYLKNPYIMMMEWEAPA